jgi:hypothetical protein
MNPKALAASLVSLVEDSAPSRLEFVDVPALREEWSALKPELIALGAFDDSDAVRRAAKKLRDAGNALFDLLAGTERELKFSEGEDLVRDHPRLHAAAADAAQELLDAVASRL